MGKRIAETQLTPAGLAAMDKGSNAPQQSANDDENQTGQAPAEELAQRKIVKVKRYAQGDKVTTKSGTGCFSLVGSLSQASKVDNALQPSKVESETKKAMPFFAPPAAQPTFAGEKIDANKTSKAEATPLFGQNKMIFSAPTADHPVFGKPKDIELQDQKKSEVKKPAGQPLFGSAMATPDIAKKPSFTTDGKQATGLFSIGSTSLFGNSASTDKKPEEKDAGQTLPLFGNGGSSLFGATAQKSEPASTSLFGGPQQQEGTKSLFGGNSAAPASGSLFGTKPAEGGSLFGGASASAPTTGGNLFGGNFGGGNALFGQPASGQASVFSNSGNLFGGNKQESETKKDGDNESDGAEPEEDEAPIYATDAAATNTTGKKEVQKSPYTKVFEKKCSLFKLTVPKDEAKEIDNGMVSLQYIENDADKRNYLIVLRVGIRPVYTGLLKHPESKIKRVGERDGAHVLKTAQVITSEKTKKKALSYAELCFDRYEDMEALEKAFKEALDQLEKQEKK